MKNFKRILAFLTMLTLLGTVVVGSAFASTAPTMTLSSATAKAGDTVDLTINVSNNPGFTATIVRVSYDSTYITLAARATNGELFTSCTPGGNISSNPYQIVFNDGFDDITANGVLANLSFKVADDAPAGEYPITLSYSEDDTYNVEFDYITFEMVSGKITVESDAPVYTEKDPEYHGLTTDATQVAKVLENVDVKNNNGEEYKIKSAIAFVSAINADAEVVEYGTNIYCAGYDGKVLTIKANNPYDVTADIKGFVAAVSSIREANYGKTFTAKAYAKLADGTIVEVEEGATGSYKPAAN